MRFVSLSYFFSFVHPISIQNQSEIFAIYSLFCSAILFFIAAIFSSLFRLFSASLAACKAAASCAFFSFRFSRASRT
jgi:hypothetical protein